MKNKRLYYFLNLTWGLPMTLIGAVTALVLMAAGKRPHRHGGCVYFTVGKKWGGVSLGLVSVVDGSENTRLKNHEYGHSVQNARFGVLMPFVVGIPSALRCWYRKIPAVCRRTKTPYDSIWFEKQASELGDSSIGMWDR